MVLYLDTAELARSGRVRRRRHTECVGVVLCSCLRRRVIEPTDGEIGGYGGWVLVAKRETAQLGAAARDRYLRFGLIGVPGRYRRPITSQMDGRPFPDLPGDEATRVVEGLALPQWPRSGVVGLLVLPFAILANNQPPTENTVGLAIFFATMFVLPAYTLIVAVVHQLMKRRSQRSNRPASSYPRLLATLLAAPYVAIVAATASGIAMR